MDCVSITIILRRSITTKFNSVRDVLRLLTESDKNPKEPPLRVDSTLHLAWGLTLFLSHDDKQGTLADQLKERLLASFQFEKLDSNGVRYVNNLITVISAYLRRMGFEKETYDEYLNAEKEKLERVTKYWQNVGDMTSFSTESTIIKVTSFLGIGSSGEFLIKWLQSFEQETKQAVVNATQTATQLNATQTATQLNATQTDTQLYSMPEIGYILIFGSIGLFTSIIFSKWFGSYRVEKARARTLSRQQEYWKKIVRTNYQEGLVHLYNDIKILVDSHYSGYTEPILSEKGKVEQVIDEILPREVIYVMPES
jgi:hypothetical protein